MINITSICTKYGILPSRFTDNPSIRNRNLTRTIKGRGGYTEIDESLMPEFLIWLKPELKSRIFSGVKWQQLWEELK